VLGALALVAVLPRSGLADFPAARFPVEAVARNVDRLTGGDPSHVPPPRVLAPDQWADYLIYHLYPRARVFFDGRSDFYGQAAGLGWHAGTSGATGLERSAGGAAVGFLVFLVFYVAGAMGAGDIKLMAAFGALLGPSGILLAALFAAPAGGLMAAAWLAWKRGARDIPYAIPYAPAITLGAWLALVGRG
jgi:prepilin peptidase CpaA